MAPNRTHQKEKLVVKAEWIRTRQVSVLHFPSTEVLPGPEGNRFMYVLWICLSAGKR